MKNKMKLMKNKSDMYSVYVHFVGVICSLINIKINLVENIMMSLPFCLYPIDRLFKNPNGIGRQGPTQQ